ncbi:hypothetical protein EmuJ_000221600 [Echinococcus multilocularis]|uniref:Uncharacterized protein n=1 Tax=Echinococcus multilocularis TaxID=6211 RepID=A0A087W1M8_ECHMU|nr:hypothetical protein EmuJ_000221600 [Echinococcus multilocularis]
MYRRHLFDLYFFLSRDIAFDFTSVITAIHCSDGSGDEVVGSLSALCLREACLADLEEHYSPPNRSPANVSSEEAEGVELSWRPYRSASGFSTLMPTLIADVTLASWFTQHWNT